MMPCRTPLETSTSISNFLRRRSWSIKSKALLRSSIRRPFKLPLSILRSNVSIMSMRAALGAGVIPQISRLVVYKRLEFLEP